MMVAPDAVLDDGVFDIVTTAEGSRFKFLANLPKVFKGTHLEEENTVSVRGGAKVEVRADRPFEVFADGEHLTDLPAELRLLPRALRVIAPASASNAPSEHHIRPQEGVARATGSSQPPQRARGRDHPPGPGPAAPRPGSGRAPGADLERGSTIVSATNGKTTTAGMISAALAAAGRDPVHNRAGSNMSWGVATALLEQQGDEGLFELDEAWLPPVAPQLRPRLVVLGNLFRDQLDRYGELVVRIREHVLQDVRPLVEDAGSGRDVGGAVAVGLGGLEPGACRHDVVHDLLHWGRSRSISSWWTVSTQQT